MPRFQIIVGPKEVQLALSYLMLIKGYSDEDAFQFLRSLFEGSFEQDDEVFYYFFANAKGTAIFDLKKGYHQLFGQGVQIIQQR